MKLLVPMKLSDILCLTTIAPPWSAELLIKLLVAVKLNDVSCHAKIALPKSAELWMKLLVPVKLQLHSYSSMHVYSQESAVQRHTYTVVALKVYLAILKSILTVKTI